MASTVSSRVAHLRSLPSIRERCAQVYALAQQGDLDYFHYHPDKERDLVDYCIAIIRKDYGENLAQIPPHGRWRHFDVGPLPRITTLLSRWASSTPPVPALEAARRLVDLFVVSVLLDAGAGTRWSYEERSTGLRFARSEGLAIASLDMFNSGMFTTAEDDSQENRCKVDAAGLANLSPDTLSMAMQVDPESNPMTGIQGRANLLANLAKALGEDSQGFFSGPAGDPANTDKDKRRPGFIVDYLAAHPSTSIDPATGRTSVAVPALWEALLYGLAPIWPASRTQLDGVGLGDVWPCDSLAKAKGVEKGDPRALVPFHKLSQWMAYSVTEPIEQTLGWTFVGGQDQTGLPEYRNGGLFVDLGVLEPTPALYAASESSSAPAAASGTSSSTAPTPVPRLPPSHPAVVEWRAMTVCLLDRVAAAIRTSLGLKEEELSLKQVLEAATWKGGREIAAQKRPQNGGGPPIDIISDGTVF